MQLTAQIDQWFYLLLKMGIDRRLTASVSVGFDGLHNEIATCRFARGSSGHEWNGEENGGNRGREFHGRHNAVDSQ